MGPNWYIGLFQVFITILLLGITAFYALHIHGQDVGTQLRTGNVSGPMAYTLVALATTLCIGILAYVVWARSALEKKSIISP
jgi:hypothetical protein